MSSKRRPRKVTVENDKIALGDISSSEKRKLSVFERLGPGAPHKYDAPEKHSTVDAESPAGVCHKWQKYGTCQYGSKCRYQHGPRREHSPDEFHHHQGDKDSESESDLNDKPLPRNSKKDKIKSTVVVTKPSTQDESESDPVHDCTDEDLQRRLSQLKQELSRLDQEERERKERGHSAPGSSDESEKDMPLVITPPSRHKKDKTPGEQSKRKKEKKKKKKKLQKPLSDVDNEKLEKKKHHVLPEKDASKLKQKALEKPKVLEKPKPVEKKKAGPMIPRAVQQKVVVKTARQSSSSPSKSPSCSPSSIRKKKLSPKQIKREQIPVIEKHGPENVESTLMKSDMTSRVDRGIKDCDRRGYSPSLRSDPRKDKVTERLSKMHHDPSPRSDIKDRSTERLVRSHRDISPRSDIRDKTGERMSRSHRDVSPVSTGSRRRDQERETSRSIGSRRSRRSLSPQSRHSDGHWSRGASRHSSSSSSSSSSDSSSSSSLSPACSRRSLSPRQRYRSPHQKSPVRHTSEHRSRSTSRHVNKGPVAYVKSGRKGKEAERSPGKRHSTVERMARDRSVPSDKKRTEHDLRKIEDFARRHEVSPLPRESHWADSPVTDKLRRRRSPEEDHKQVVMSTSDSRHDQVDVMTDRRKLDSMQSSRSHSSREVSDKRAHSKVHEDYAAASTDYDTRTHSPQTQTTDRHRTDYSQYREGYATSTSDRDHLSASDHDRYADREHYDVYARDTRGSYRRTDERTRETDRDRDYVSSAVIDSRDRDRYETSYDHSHYASYTQDTDRLDVRRDYSAYYDERGRLIEDTSRLRSEDLRRRTTDERARDEYSRSYDRYRYVYDYGSSTRSDLERRRDSSREVSSDRTRSHEWARWERERHRDDPRLLEPDLTRSLHDSRDLIDPRDLVRDHARESHADAHVDLRIKVHKDVRTDVRGDSHLDLRADPRVDLRDVRMASRSRDRSIDNRDSRLRTERDRLVDPDHKDLSLDHLSRRSEWEQRDVNEKGWPSDKTKDRLPSGSRKRLREAGSAAKSPTSKHRREGSLDKDFQIRRSLEHDVHKPPSSRIKPGDHLQEARHDRKQNQDRKGKDPESLYAEKLRDKDYERDRERDSDRREKKYDKSREKSSKDLVDRDKADRDSRSTCSHDADSKESRDSRSKESDLHTTDPEQDRIYDQHSWASKEGDVDLDRERQERLQMKKIYDKERDKSDKETSRSTDKDKIDDTCVGSSIVTSSHRADYKRHRSHSVDSPRKRSRRKGHEGETASDWSNPEKDMAEADHSYKHETVQSPQVTDDRYVQSPGHSSLTSKHSIHDEDRDDHRDDRRDDPLSYEYDRELRLREEAVSGRHSRSDALYHYPDKSHEVYRTRSVDRTVSSHYADRHDEHEPRDDYVRDAELCKSDARSVDALPREWTEVDRIAEDELRTCDPDHDRADRERIADVGRGHSVDRLDWSGVYRDHRTENYAESCHSYRSDRVYTDSRVDSYSRDPDRLVADRISTTDKEPLTDRRDPSLECSAPRLDIRPAEHRYYDMQDTKRDRYPENWPAYLTSTTSVTPNQLDTVLPAAEPASILEEKPEEKTIEYDPVSDDDLDDIIGPDPSSDTGTCKPQKTGIVDILDIDWASLMKQNEKKPVTASSALKRFTAGSIFMKIGVSLPLAGEELYCKIENICQKHLEDITNQENKNVSSDQTKVDVKKEEEEKETHEAEKTEPFRADVHIKTEVDEKPHHTESILANADMMKPDDIKQEEEKPEDKSAKDEKPETKKAEVKKFKFLHSVAEFHVSLSAKKRERELLLKDVGPYRRALCARRDLYMRKKICRLDVDCDSLHLYPAQMVDQELYRQSVQIFKSERPQPLVAGLSTKPASEQEIVAS